jgi:hypothetical protein
VGRLNLMWDSQKETQSGMKKYREEIKARKEYTERVFVGEGRRKRD